MPVFLAGMFGLMDYGWYFYNEAMTIEATRQGCRIGSVVPEGNTPSPASVTTTYISGELIDIGIRSTAPSTSHSSFSTSSGETVNAFVNTSTTPHRLECDTYLQFQPLVGFVPTPGFVLSSAVFSLEQPT
ncbi:MAG: pilus assembly protein [Proteobacteria bacterium]|nr:pilus assembly protein [Pseudomonadota bacterium]